MQHLDSWLVGLVVGVFGLIALYVASVATSSFVYATGLLLFVSAVVFNFYIINHTFNRNKSK